MRAIVPLDRFSIDQTKKRLVDECRRLEAMARALTRHAALRDPMELVMDERDQSLERTMVALAPLEQQSCDVGGVSRSVPS